MNSLSDDKLTDSEKLSKAVLEWDCDMSLNQASFKNDVF